MSGGRSGGSGGELSVSGARRRSRSACNSKGARALDLLGRGNTSKDRNRGQGVHGILCKIVEEAGQDLLGAEVRPRRLFVRDLQRFWGRTGE